MAKEQKQPEKKTGGKKSKYTAAQRKAYATGKAYRLGRDGKKIEFKNEENKKSFQQGYRAGGKTKHKKLDKAVTPAKK